MGAVLETERMCLRPMRPSDAGALHAAWGNAEAMRFWDWPPARSLAVTRAIVTRQCQEARLGGSLYWAMLIDGKRDPIGACDLSEIDTHHRRGEIGFLLVPSYWRQGYAREAMAAVVDYALNVLKLERLSARTHSGNQASIRLLKRLGFAHEGTLAGYVWRDGARRDCELFGLVRVKPSRTRRPSTSKRASKKRD